MAGQRWWQGLLADSEAVVVRLLDEPAIDVASLQDQVRAYRAHVRAAARPVTDVPLADALSDATLALLDATAAAPASARRLVQVAARYFVLQDDGDDDLISAFGFDDDVEVFNAVVSALGQPQRALAY